MEHPVEAHFAQIKDRARRREIPFTITLSDFREAIAGTGYTEKRGREAHCLHLDRIDALKGYEPGNIRVLVASENCSKGATADKERRRQFVEQKIRGRYPTPEPESDPWDEWYDSDQCHQSSPEITAECPF